MRVQTPLSTLFVALLATSVVASAVFGLEGSARAQQLRSDNGPPMPKVGGPVVQARVGTAPRSARNVAPHPAVPAVNALPGGSGHAIESVAVTKSALPALPNALASASTSAGKAPAWKSGPAKLPSPAKPAWHAPVTPAAHAPLAAAPATPHPHAVPGLAPQPAGSFAGAPFGSTGASSGPSTGSPNTTAVAGIDPAVAAHDDLDNKTVEIDTGWTAKTADDDRTAAIHYGQLGRDECIAEARSRAIPFVVVDSARGVLAPIRLTGPLRGINIHSPIPANQRPTSVYEIMDCRLVLALDDLAQLLKPHEITEIVHMSVYRPPSKGFPDGKQGTRHEGALALDLGHFEKRDGSKLVVEQDYHGFIGQKPCGAGTGPLVRNAASIELRQLACEVLEKKLFSVFLTPGFNAAHHNHFHIEVSANSRGFYVR